MILLERCLKRYMSSGSYALYICKYLLIYQRNVWPPPSGASCPRKGKLCWERLRVSGIISSLFGKFRTCTAVSRANLCSYISRSFWSLEDDASGPAIWGVGLRPLACWECGFGSPTLILPVAKLSESWDPRNKATLLWNKSNKMQQLRFILRSDFTLHVSGDNLTHHQEYICCIWPQVSWLT